MSENRRIEHLKRHPNDLQSKYRLSPKSKNTEDPRWLEVLGAGFIAILIVTALIFCIRWIASVNSDRDRTNRYLRCLATYSSSSEFTYNHLSRICHTYLPGRDD